MFLFFFCFTPAIPSHTHYSPFFAPLFVLRRSAFLYLTRVLISFLFHTHPLFSFFFLHLVLHFHFSPHISPTPFRPFHTHKIHYIHYTRTHIHHLSLSCLVPRLFPVVAPLFAYDRIFSLARHLSFFSCSSSFSPRIVFPLFFVLVVIQKTSCVLSRRSAAR